MIKKSVELTKTDKKSVEIKKINILSLANILGIIYAVIGLISVLIIYITLSLPIPVESLPDINNPLIEQYGYLSIIIYPIIYWIMGFVSGLIIGLLYNLFAKKIGGIKVELY